MNILMPLRDISKGLPVHHIETPVADSALSASRPRALSLHIGSIRLILLADSRNLYSNYIHALTFMNGLRNLEAILAVLFGTLLICVVVDG